MAAPGDSAPHSCWVTRGWHLVMKHPLELGAGDPSGGFHNEMSPLCLQGTCTQPHVTVSCVIGYTEPREPCVVVPYIKYPRAAVLLWLLSATCTAVTEPGMGWEVGVSRGPRSASSPPYSHRLSLAWHKQSERR